MKKLQRFIFWGSLIFIFIPQLSKAQYNFHDVPVLQILDEIEEKDGYRILYRESQLADISLSFSATSSSLLQTFIAELARYNVSVETDTARKQIVLYKTNRISSQNILISGQVVDALSGERLPYATVFWERNGAVNGVASNSSGVFRVEDSFREKTIVLNASFLGYETNKVSLDLSKNTVFKDLTIRLQPTTLQANDLIVTGFSFPVLSDSIYRNFVNAGVLNPLGENNITKALQSLPSVSTGPALNNGVHVRGSSADATHIMLDGITIYNQSHLFGLLDSFNPSALKTSGFFYDITPAQFPSSPGGTLSLLTKTGSLNDLSASAGLSNTAFNATMQGPISRGKSSWLVSGRTSYMNALNWFQNDQLIAFGLNVDRPNNLSETVSDLESRLVFPGTYDANFFDLHSKLYFEFKNGSRLIAGAYYGADDVSQNAERLVRNFEPSTPNQRFARDEVETLNSWGNFSSSLSFKSPVSSRLYCSILAGVSIYNSEFSKDDFVYNRVEQSGNRFEVFTYPLRNKSVFNEIKIDQSLDLILPNTQWVFGASYQYFMGEYFESSFDRPGYLTTFRSYLFDLYAQMDLTSLKDLDIHIGSRLHYYTDGDYLYYSPRIKLKFFKNRDLSFGLGYSRNYQFTHRLSFYNVSSPDVWVISSREQAPTSADYFSGGLYFKPASSTIFQIEGYLKNLSNARLFDINAQTLMNGFNASPWFYGNKGTAKGVEILLKNRFKKFSITNSYAWTEATFSNPNLFNGESFYAEWDRTHSINIIVDYEIISDLNLFLGFNWSTGVPNRLYFLEVEEQERLDPYRRVDAGLEYQLKINNARMEFNASVYNLFDHQNDWYRELNLVIDTSAPINRRRISSQAIDVYDLGFQPSFNVMVWF